MKIQNKSRIGVKKLGNKEKVRIGINRNLFKVEQEIKKSKGFVE